MSENAVSELANGWLQIKVPLPYSLKWVNAYLLPEQTGWTLIDPGLRTEEIESFWNETLAELDIRLQDIRTIVLTHHHPDHYGLAGWFQERSGATVWMSKVAHGNAMRLWGENETFSDELTDAFLRHGLAEELEDEIRNHMRGFRGKVSPQPEDVRYISPGERFPMGGTEWEVYGGEGHAPGHLLFYERESGRLICGDQVLPDITPNIGWMPGGDPDPLKSFMDSLHGVGHLEVSIVFPGHRDPFSSYRQRIEELLGHHERRMRKMADLIGDDEKSAFEVCELMFGTRLRNNAHNLRFALAETIAHLVRMEKLGMIVRLEPAVSDGARPTIRYRKAP